MKNKLKIVMFIGFLLIFSVGSLIVKDREFSDMENRKLQAFPELSVGTLASGAFTSEFEKYMSDQIIMKDGLVRLKTQTNLVLNQKYINGVYFAEDDRLISDYEEPYAQLDKNITYINEFVQANDNLNCIFFAIPTASHVYAEDMPDFAENYDQGEVLEHMRQNFDENLKVIDCEKELCEAKDEYIFYKTDHHWTMNGAYIGYKKLCDELSLKAADKTVYDISVGSDEFYGTLYSKAPTFFQEKDSIILYNNPSGRYEVEYIDKSTSSDSLYMMKNLEIKDKYTTYLDGNHSIISIKSNAVSATADGDKKLLVVKDSYAHTLLPLLADNYSEIIVVDLRYYHKSVSALAEENNIKDVLFINNIDFISTDNNFLWLQ